MTIVEVTGATGFVGRNLIPFLERKGAVVHQISRSMLSSINSDDFDQKDVIIHLAGKAHDLRNTANPSEYYDVNLELTKNIYDAFLKSDVKKFIFISSVKAAADSVNGILDESFSPNPETHYGKSKLMAEEYIQQRSLPTGKSYYILRPCMIHGPGNKGNLNLLYQLVKKRMPYPLAAFNNARSFLSVDNLCFVINELISQEAVPSGVYHVADDEALSTGEVVRILAGSLNKAPRLWEISPRFIKVLARVGDTLHLPLTTERLNKLTESYVVSNQKLKIAINKSLPLSAREGLRITALSFKEELYSNL